MSKFWKYLLALIGLILLVLLFLIFYQGSTEPIKKVADQFKPSSGWTLTAERVTPPQFHCLGGPKCPSLQRNWKTGAVLTKDEFREVLDRSGWNFPIEKDCIPSTMTSGSPSTVCSASGTVGGFQVKMRALGTYDKPNDGIVVLSIE